MNFFRMGHGQDDKPFLTEPGVKSFISGVLKGCHQIKSHHYNKWKLTPEEKERKKQEEKQYILTKLNNVSAVIKMDRSKGGVTHANLITDLPSW